MYSLRIMKISTEKYIKYAHKMLEPNCETRWVVDSFIWFGWSLASPLMSPHTREWEEASKSQHIDELTPKWWALNHAYFHAKKKFVCIFISSLQASSLHFHITTEIGSHQPTSLTPHRTAHKMTTRNIRIETKCRILRCHIACRLPVKWVSFGCYYDW